MILSSTLQSLKDHIEGIGVVNADPKNPYQVQITPDERPFPYSGENIITIYPTLFSRENLLNDQRKFNISCNICVTRRVGSVPHDRQFNPLYLDTFVSLSKISEILAYSIDLNNTLLNNITTNIITIKDNLVSTLVDKDPDTSGLEDQLGLNLDTIELIGPIKISSIQAAPIPRFDDFFTAYNTKKDYDRPFENNRIQPSGYSMMIQIQGPSGILAPYCE